jgi:hypothetical protein
MEQLKCRLFEQEVKVFSEKSHAHRWVYNSGMVYIYMAVDNMEEGDRLNNSRSLFQQNLERLEGVEFFYPEDAIKIREIANKYLAMTKSVQKEVFRIGFFMNKNSIYFEKCIDDDKLHIEDTAGRGFILNADEIKELKEFLNSPFNKEVKRCYGCSNFIYENSNGSIVCKFNEKSKYFGDGKGCENYCAQLG